MSDARPPDPVGAGVRTGLRGPTNDEPRDRIQLAGGRVTLHETEGAFHDFMAATVNPEAKAVYRQIRRDLGGH